MRSPAGGAFLLTACFLVASTLWLMNTPRASLAREAWTSSRIAGSPEPPPPYRVEVAFPKLKFRRPVLLTHEPTSGRLFVAEQGGRILSFPNDPGVSQADVVIDLRAEIDDVSAVYGLAFHPNFAENRLTYVCYVKQPDRPDETYVSSFRMSDTDPPTLDATSERVVIRWRSGGHNGGCLKFGPDGYLYISTGDAAGPDPPDPLRAGQDVSNLMSAILRIDVDQTNGALEYRIPDDNPFVSMPNARPEIWAYGFRNPWRMSFDRRSGDLWVGDVGWQLWEMIYRVERGGNYGWAIMEGPQPALPAADRGPTPILPPTVSHPHSEAASITGGYVYYGDRLPNLRGAYIYGDYQSGIVWALRLDPSSGRVTWQEQIAQTAVQLVAFGDDVDGELYLVDHSRTHQIYHLTANEVQTTHEQFPRRLSETGLFESMVDETPATGVVAYSINAHQWADYTDSRRWFAVPGSDAVEIGARGWRFPEGSVLAKTVSIDLVQGDPSSRQRLETQILHFENGRWHPYTFAWNEQQTDAELVSASGSTREVSVRDEQAPGGVRRINYRLASRAECQICHNPWVGQQAGMFGVQSASPLAVSVAQWNGPALIESSGHAGSESNQLASLRDAGWLSGGPHELESASRFPNPYDASADLSARARAYLHVNCAHCHQPNAGGTATIRLTAKMSLESSQVLDAKPSQGVFGISHARIIAPADPSGSVLLYRMAKMGGGRMPRLGSTEVDWPAVSLIHDWIAQMPSTEHSGDQALTDWSEDLNRLQHATADEREQALRRLTDSTRGAVALLRYVREEKPSGDLRAQILSVAARHPQPEVRDLFESFVPANERVERLGSLIDRDMLLSLDGDPTRGRVLFFRDGVTSCKSCHRVGDEGETLGPDLSKIGKKYPPRELLTHLLEPSKSIEPAYVPHVIETEDGRVLTGLLAERHEDVILLKTAQNKQLQIRTDEIESMVTQQQSLMPDQMLRDLTAQEAADLLAFLSSLR